MRRKSSYERAEEYIEEIDTEIEFEYGKPYAELSRSDQKQAILEHFFKGLPQYDQSARDLRDGIEYSRIAKGEEVTISRIKFSYGERRVVRGTDGRFRKWVE